MDEQLIKIVAQYGIGGVFALVLGRIMWRIGERMIAAIDGLGTKWQAAADKMAERFDAHTKADVEAIGGFARKLEHLDGKFDAVLDAHERTPVNGVPITQHEDERPEPKLLRSGSTPAAGTPTAYAQHKQRGRSHGG